MPCAVVMLQASISVFLTWGGFAMRLKSHEHQSLGSAGSLDMEEEHQREVFAQKLSETMASMTSERKAGKMELVSDREVDKVIRSAMSDLGTLGANVTSLLSEIMASHSFAQPMRHMLRVGLSLGDDAEINDLVAKVGHATAACEPSDTSCVVGALMATGPALADVAKQKFHQSAHSLIQWPGAKSVYEFLDGDSSCAASPRDMLIKRQYLNWYYCYVLEVAIEMFIARVGKKGRRTEFSLGLLWFEEGRMGSYVMVRYLVAETHPHLHHVDLNIDPNWAGMLKGAPLDVMVKVFVSFSKKPSVSDQTAIFPWAATSPTYTTPDIGMWTRHNMDSAYYRRWTDPTYKGMEFANYGDGQVDVDLGLLETYTSFKNKSLNVYRVNLRTTARQTLIKDKPWLPWKAYVEYPPLVLQAGTPVVRDFAIAMLWLIPWANTRVVMDDDVLQGARDRLFSGLKDKVWDKMPGYCYAYRTPKRNLAFDPAYFAGTDPGLVILVEPPRAQVGNINYVALPPRCCLDPELDSPECGDFGFDRKLYGVGNPYFPPLPAYTEECFHAQADTLVTVDAGGCWPVEAVKETLHNR